MDRFQVELAGELAEGFGAECAARCHGHQQDTAGERPGADMASATQLGQTGLQGWREKVADGISQPVAKRAPLDEDQVRAIVGAGFFLLAVTYVGKTISEAMRQARQG